VCVCALTLALTLCATEDAAAEFAAEAHGGRVDSGGGGGDDDLELALQLSREAAAAGRPAGDRECMDEELQMALAASLSEADEVARQALAGENAGVAGTARGSGDSRAGGRSRKKAERNAGGGAPPAGAQVLVLDSDSDDDSAGHVKKRKRLKGR
jgi:hypothetical protein